MSSYVDDFIRRTTSFVSLERSAELEEETSYKSTKNSKELEAAGVLLTRLVVTDQTTGLYGRCLLTLEPARGGPLKQSELGVRDIVELSSMASSSNGSTKLSTGVVYRLKENSLTIVLDEFLDATDTHGQLSLLKLSNEVTYDRYKYAIDCLKKEFESSSSSLTQSSRLLRILYDDLEPVSATRHLPWTPFSSSLNAQQKIAIQAALHANDLYILHGFVSSSQTSIDIR